MLLFQEAEAEFTCDNELHIAVASNTYIILYLISYHFQIPVYRASFKDIWGMAVPDTSVPKNHQPYAVRLWVAAIHSH